MWQHFDGISGKILVKKRNTSAQAYQGVVHRYRIAGYPNTKFVVFQTCLKIWHQDFQQVLLSIKEIAEMSSPGRTANDIETGISEMIFHRGNLHWQDVSIKAND